MREATTNQLPDDAMSQCDWILSQLKAGRALTALECTMGFGVGRPAARVGELRNLGHNITTELVPVDKANGRKARVGVYRLAGGAS